MSNKDIDWSDLYKNGYSKDPREEALIKSLTAQSKWKQPTKEEIEALLKAMFPNAPKTQEDIDKIEKAYQNTLNDWFREAQKPIDNKHTEWPSGKSFNDTLTPEELKKRDMHLGEEE